MTKLSTELMSMLQQANTALQAQDIDTAISIFEDILIHEPKQYEANVYLGRLFLQRGDHARASTYLKSAVDINPSDPALQNALGMSYYALQDYAQAENCYKQVVSLVPGEIIGYANLAILYQDAGKRDSALEYAKKVVDLSPGLVAGYVLMASSLNLKGEFEQALMVFDQALDLEPGNLDALTGKSNALLKLGRFDQANNIISALIEQGVVSHALANVYVSIAKKYGHTQKALDYVDKILGSVQLTPSQTMQLHFGAGELLDSADRYDEAIVHYKKANELVCRDYDSMAYDAIYQRCIVAYTDSKNLQYASWRGDVVPVFVVGMPRSGTSLLERILGMHSQISAAGELPYINNIINALAEKCGAIYPDLVTRLSESDLNSAARSYIEDVRVNTGKGGIFIDKMPHNFMYLGMIRQLFPESPIIHCNRNALDTCLSNFFQYFSGDLAYPYRQEDIAHQYNFYQDMMQLWEGVGIDMLDVTYESLVTNPETTLESIMQYLGLEIETGCLQFHQSSEITRTASVEQVRQPLYSRSIGRWKHYDKHLSILINLLDQRS